MSDIPVDIQNKDAEADAAMAEFEKANARDPSDGSLGELVLEEPAAPSKADAKVAPESDLLQKQLEYERHRNDSLQGRVDSQLRAQNELVQQLRQELAAMRQQAAVPQAALHKRVLKPEELEAIGETTAEMQSRIATTAAQEAVAQARVEMDGRMQAMEQAQAQAHQSQSGSAFWGAVDKLAPGAKEANDVAAPKWVNFLNGVDEASGRPRMELGEAAVRSGDVRRVAELYRECFGEVALAKAKDVTSQVRPAPATSGQTTPRKPPMIRESEMKKFYDDLQRGKYAGQEEKAKKIEQAIENAVLEGRILSG